LVNDKEIKLFIGDWFPGICVGRGDSRDNTGCALKITVTTNLLILLDIELACWEDPMVQDLEGVHDSPDDIIRTSAAQSISNAVYGVLRVRLE
jgi:hypothetical protein